MKLPKRTVTSRSITGVVRYLSPILTSEAAEKLRFWVAQRFQRRDKALFSMRASAPEVLKRCFSAASSIVLFAVAVASVRAQDTIYLAGSGSNLAGPLIAAWTDEFNKKDSHIQVRYLPLSSAEGFQQMAAHSGDFAVGEIPLSREQMQDPKSPLVQIPVLLVGIVPIYNLPGKPALRFTGELLAQIYLGTVSNWSDSRIAKLNPGVALPSLAITVVHRTKGRGTSYIFTDFLSKTSSEFRTRIGRSASPNWPLGIATNRSLDAVEKVESTPGAISYVELSFAIRSGLAYGSVQNSAGKFVKANPTTMSAAYLAMEQSTPKGASFTDAPGLDSYPVIGFSWFYVPASGLAPERSEALKFFLNWVLEQGQKMAPLLGYIPLPASVASKAQEDVRSIH